MNRVKIPRVFFCPEALFKALLFVFFCLTMLNTPACEKKKPEAPAPPAVEVVEVIQKDVPIYEEWVGTADGFVNATIRAQVQGYLVNQNYKEGDFVRKGQTLFEIDPRTFQAALEQAKGQLAVQQASWDTAKANLKRLKPLAEQNAVSQKDLDKLGTRLTKSMLIWSARLSPRAGLKSKPLEHDVTEHAKTMPWFDHEFIRIWSGERGHNLCYRANSRGNAVLEVAFPGRKVVDYQEFLYWAHMAGWRVSLPSKLHVDVA